MKKIIIYITSILVLSILILLVNYIVFAKNSSIISKGKPIIHKDSMKKAVLVIDIQEGITGKLSDNDYYMMKSEELINNINQIADSSVKNNIPVIYIKNEISNFLINILNNSLAKGSSGAELDSRLKIVSGYIINKDKKDAFSNSSLDSILIRNDINCLVFVGLDLAQCVNNTILAAVNRNYDICLISDALISESDSLEKVMFARFKQRGFEITSGIEYFENINR